MNSRESILTLAANEAGLFYAHGDHHDHSREVLFEDQTRKRRYALSVITDLAGPTLMYIMLNPSITDETRTDSTVKRCIASAEAWGYGRLIVVNCFSYVDKNPETLYGCPDPVGRANDKIITSLSKEADLIIVAWGNHGRLGRRSRHVLSLLPPDKVHCLQTTKLGEPSHPGRLRLGLLPIRYPHASNAHCSGLGRVR